MGIVGRFAVERCAGGNLLAALLLREPADEAIARASCFGQSYGVADGVIIYALLARIVVLAERERPGADGDRLPLSRGFAADHEAHFDCIVAFAGKRNGRAGCVLNGDDIFIVAV